MTTVTKRKSDDLVSKRCSEERKEVASACGRGHFLPRLIRRRIRAQICTGNAPRLTKNSGRAKMSRDSRQCGGAERTRGGFHLLEATGTGNSTSMTCDSSSAYLRNGAWYENRSPSLAPPRDHPMIVRTPSNEQRPQMNRDEHRSRDAMFPPRLASADPC